MPFPPFYPAWVDQTVNFEYCSYSTTKQPLPIYRAIPRFTIGAALLILFVVPTLTHTYEIYRLTGRWHINRAMELLVKEGAVYFVVYVPLVFALPPSPPVLPLSTSCR